MDISGAEAAVESGDVVSLLCTSTAARCLDVNGGVVIVIDLCGFGHTFTYWLEAPFAIILMYDHYDDYGFPIDITTTNIMFRPAAVLTWYNGTSLFPEQPAGQVLKMICHVYL